MPSLSRVALAATVLALAACGDTPPAVTDAGTTCTAGAACTTNPSPCSTGKVSCASGSATCVDDAPRAAGTTCGGGVCDGAGGCKACVADSACSTNPNACLTGKTVCASGAPVCADDTAKSAGTACTVGGGAGVCSGSGTCTACVAGAACSTNPNACLSGKTVCTSGAPVCVDDTAKSAGSTCSVGGGEGVCSGSGTCVACVASAACTTNSNPCLQGKTVCTSGAPVCANDTAKSAGTACTVGGVTGVCSGTGACNACVTGAPCATNPNACLNGKTVCSTGAAVCVDDTPKSAGATCTGGVCNGAGSCSACTAGAACSTNPNACMSGKIDCSTGASVCVNDASKTAGVACTGGVCDGAGTCNACVADAACASNPAAPCKAGKVVCTSGAPVCTDAANTAAGTACTASGGGAGVCSGAGACVACVAGQACATNPGAPCLTGKVTCGTGAPVCVDDAPAAEATSCGGGGACLGGACLPPVSITGTVNLATTAVSAGRTCAESPTWSVVALTSTTAMLSPAPPSACLAPNDLVLLINLQGTPGANTNAGRYEFLRVQSINGATVTFATAKVNAYGDATGSDANVGTGVGQQKVMLQRVPTFGVLTIPAGAAVSTSAWDGVRGGVVAVRAASVVVAGTIHANALGFRDGAMSMDDNSCSDSVATEAGESYTGPPVVQTTANGGGSGGMGAGSASFWGSVPLPGSAGHGGAGAAGANPVGRTLGAPGNAYASSDASRLFLGSGSGGTMSCQPGAFAPYLVGTRPQGAGGLVMLLAESITVSGALQANGGSNAASGGTVVLRGGTVSVGSGLVRATGSTRSLPNTSGTISNTGASGPVFIDYRASLTGTTTPAATASQNSTLQLP